MENALVTRQLHIEVGTEPENGSAIESGAVRMWAGVGMVRKSVNGSGDDGSGFLRSCSGCGWKLRAEKPCTKRGRFGFCCVIGQNRLSSTGGKKRSGVQPRLIGSSMASCV